MGRTRNTTTDVQTSTQVTTTVNQAIKEDSKTENLNLHLYPNIINTIYTDNQTVSSIPADKVLLVGQTTKTENGYYDGNVKQTLTQGSNFFIDEDGKTGVYNAETTNGEETFTQVFFHNINMWYVKTQASTDAIDAINIPIRQDKPCVVEAEIMGYRTADYSKSFHGSYRKSIYYDGTTYHDGGAMETKLKRTDTNFPYPSVSFTINATERKIVITPGDATSTKWFVKGRVSF
jgi:hypothetical protein